MRELLAEDPDNLLFACPNVKTRQPVAYHVRDRARIDFFRVKIAFFPTKTAIDRNKIAIDRAKIDSFRIKIAIFPTKTAIDRNKTAIDRAKDRLILN